MAVKRLKLTILQLEQNMPPSPALERAASSTYHIDQQHCTETLPEEPLI